MAKSDQPKKTAQKASAHAVHKHESHMHKGEEKTKLPGGRGRPGGKK